MSMGARAVALALLGALCGLVRPSGAEPVLSIAVEREAGAEDCPDTNDLNARVRAVLGHDAEQSAAYRVVFSRSAQEYSAAIHSGEGSTVRYLHARERSCAGLAHATTLALAVLFDADLAGIDPAASASTESAAPRPPLATASPAASNSEKTAPLPSATPARRAHVAPAFSLGAAAMVGVLRPVAPAFLADTGLVIDKLRLTLGALWVPPQILSLPPGSARESLLSGVLRACYAVWRGDVLRLEGCSGALVGAAGAEARGFATNERHTELFLAFPAEVAVAARTGAFAWELGASLLVVCPPNEFRVEGRGPTYQPAPVAGIFSLRVVFEP
jgi:hypothetical protein